MQKLITYIIIVGSILVIVFIAVGAYFLLNVGSPSTSPKSAEQTQNTPPAGGGYTSSVNINQTPVSTQTPTASSTQNITIPGEDGEPIYVKDFLRAPTTVADQYNEGHYLLSGDDLAAEISLPYTILYVEADKSFTVGILAEPLNASRDQAEQFLMRLLGVPIQDMCRLPYTVLVPYSVNQVYSGKNLGFSFCTGATPL